MSDASAVKLGKMIEYNTSIVELYLHWNQIKAQGGNAIINGLSSNRTLRVLDLSWNSLGLHQSNFAKTFAEYIAENKTLLHLDLSNNYFCKEDCKVISEGLNNNHTLYGFHFHGNIGYVDAKGFLIIPEDYYQSSMSQHIIPPINGKFL
jgi:Leucine Rich Repeat.